jgi:hypothetical protein
MDPAALALLCGFTAAIAAILVTRAIEIFGGTLGGVIATLPTTIVPASIGMATALSSEGLRRACFTVPPGMVLSGIFLWQWRYWPSRLPQAWSFGKRLTAMLLISFSVWFIMAAIVVSIEQSALQSTDSIVAFGIASYFAVGVSGLIASLKPLEAPKGSKSVGWKMMLARGCAAGTAITICVGLSSVNGIIAGMASTFPAIFSTIMVGLWVAQGSAVSAGAAGPMVLGGLSPPSYALFFSALYEPLGMVGACVVSWLLASCCVSAPVALFLQWRRRVSEAQRSAAAAAAGNNKEAVGADAATEIAVGSAAASAASGKAVEQANLVAAASSEETDGAQVDLGTLDTGAAHVDSFSGKTVR